ncbi:carbohydrate-binding domain-containing protein [Flexithrix dorotheae]|uniref:carbohydrate-binding domain-containing protein n=1 Tax=Flexithrix dorotheae TaxID=70993 RepID=UPI00037DDB4A|nr:carbohydrate-binding domain-containing protein [Flexithrix dorotheae]
MSLIKKKRVWLSSVIILLLGLYISTIHGFLSVSNPIKAKILVVEGWLPNYALEEAAKEFTENDYDFIITTGMPLDPEYRMVTNGNLIFVPPKADTFPYPGNMDQPELIIGAKSTPLLGGYAKFKLFVNSKEIDDIKTTGEFKNYNFNLNMPLSAIDTIRIRYYNDAFKNGEDRDLFVDSVKLAGKSFSARTDYFIYDRGTYGGTDIFKTNSIAEYSANYLKYLEIEEDKILAIAAEEKELNRTKSSVMAVKKWLEENTNETTSINVITLGTHSRRSWMIYEKQLSELANVGIITLDDIQYDKNSWYLSPKGWFVVLKESAKYIYTMIFL